MYSQGVQGWTVIAAICLLAIVLVPTGVAAQVSEATDECLVCHESVTPGIVADWRQSRHADVTPAAALEADELARRVSADSIPVDLADIVVGCAECHMANGASRGDSFEHNGYTIHTVVSPPDCAVCHTVEKDQYDQNLMSHAYANLEENAHYRSLVDGINCNTPALDGQSVWCEHGSRLDAGSCLACHGTTVEPTGVKTRETDFGEMEFPILSGWPNRGVGRVNPDWFDRSLYPLPQPPRFFGNGRAQAVHVLRMPQRPGYACLQSLFGEQARQPVLFAERRLGLRGDPLDGRP